MKDVAPELLAVLQEDFRRRFNASTHIKKLNARLSAGEATYEEAHAYAIEVGEMLAAVYGDNLSSDVLPDGKMYFNIAERVIKPTMKQNYELISAYSAEVQELLNEKAGLHLGAVKPKFNENRVDGIVERLSGEDDFDKAKWLLGEPVENFSQAVVDDTVKANVETQYNAGLSPKVVRKGRSDGCSWCKALAGSYAYPDVPADVYRRHEYCRCLVEYHPGDGRRQNVHTKKWVDPEQAQKVEQRKNTGLPEANAEKMAERKIAGFADAGKRNKLAGHRSRDEKKEFRPVSRARVVNALRKEFATWAASLSGKEFHAIQKYTKNSLEEKALPREEKFYYRLNAMLRGEIPEDEKLREYANTISGALSRVRLKSDIVCYRDVDVDITSGKDIGDEFRIEQFFSTTVTKKKKMKGKYRVVIFARKGTKGAYLDEISLFPKQREFLIDRDTRFRVLFRQGNEITLEVIEDE